MKSLCSDDRKKRELEIFKRYLNWAQVKHLDVHTVSNDPPDIVLKTSMGNIYVEHTRMMCMRGEHDTSRSASLEKLVKQIEQVYIEKYPDSPVCASVDFKYEIDITQSNRRRLVSELVSKLHAHLPSGYEPVVIYGDVDLLKEVSIITLSRLPRPMKSSIAYDSVRLYGPLKEQEFKTPVQKKNGDAIRVNFNHEYSEAWLLLETGQKHASFADLEIPNTWIEPEWIFTRIIIYDPFHGKREPEFVEVIK